MNNRKTLFRFKHFDCHHGASTMKIGVDAVLLGAWTDVSKASSILDAGCGCGVISLMCAQRNSRVRIEAIDIDTGSVEEAAANFKSSRWNYRLSATLKDFNNLEGQKYDLIISNPPYFSSGIDNPTTARLKARHEASLSPAILLIKGKEILATGGSVAMVAPFDRHEEIKDIADAEGYALSRACLVRGLPESPIKRCLMQFVSGNASETAAPELDELTLESSPGMPTPEHRELCRDFYLKF